jgi:hypothetical protein
VAIGLRAVRSVTPAYSTEGKTWHTVKLVPGRAPLGEQHFQPGEGERVIAGKGHRRQWGQWGLDL